MLKLTQVQHPACDFLSVESKCPVNCFLECAFKYGFCSRLNTTEASANDADIDL